MQFSENLTCSVSHRVGTKPLSPKGTVAEEKFLDVHTLETVETFFSR